MDSCSSGRGGGRNPGGFQSMFIGAGNLAAKGGRAPDGRGVASPCASKAEDGRRREKKRDTMCKREFPLRMHLQRMQSIEDAAEASSHGDAKGEKIVTKSKDTRERRNNFDEGKMLGFFCQVWRWRQPPAWFRCQTPRQKKKSWKRRGGHQKKRRGEQKKTSRRSSSSPFFSPPSRLFSSFPFFLLAPQIEERSGKPSPILLRRRRHKQWLAKNRD